MDFVFVLIFEHRALPNWHPIKINPSIEIELCIRSMLLKKYNVKRTKARSGTIVASISFLHNMRVNRCKQTLCWRWLNDVAMCLRMWMVGFLLVVVNMGLQSLRLRLTSRDWNITCTDRLFRIVGIDTIAAAGSTCIWSKDFWDTFPVLVAHRAGGNIVSLYTYTQRGMV